jgi:DNA-nicking Smr family endonuclease
MHRVSRNAIVDNWKRQQYDPDVDIEKEEEIINALKLEIKELERKKREAYKNGLREQLNYFINRKTEKEKDLKNSILNIIKHSILDNSFGKSLNISEEFPFTCVVDFHGLKVKEAEVLGELLLEKKDVHIKKMKWITGVGNHSKNNFSILKQKLKGLLQYYDISYEEQSDRLIFSTNW